MTQYDIILVSGEYLVDHPLSPVGVIKKVLEHKGFSVAVIEKPNWKTNLDFQKFGKPKLFFGVTAGSIDSMLCNYTPLKKKRAEDENEPYDSGMPDRAVIVYCNKIRENFKDSMIVLGGIEASMRRFGHYDYWDNTLRKSILVDSRADILVYGNGEWQIVEIAKRVKTVFGKVGEKLNLTKIEGTCIISNTIPEEFNGQKFQELPSFDEIKADKKAFCKMQTLFSNELNLAQKQDTRYVLQYKMHQYTPKEIDEIYSLDYSREIPKYYPEFKMIQFTVTTHRGCIGNCNFCSIALHQGNKIISRSEESILNEIKQITKHKDFIGYIDDLGGPSANMYGMDCKKCNKTTCLTCENLDRSHKRLIQLMKKAREIPGIKKIYVRSGIRYDLAIESEEYIRDLSDHHISGSLKIAPEHFSTSVLSLMNKKDEKDTFNKFKTYFEKYNRPKKQELKYYLMTAHPGSSIKEAEELANSIRKLRNTESIQIFTPTPMSVSTCMYYTGMNPYTLQEIYVPYSYNEKKKQKNMLYFR